MAGSHHHVHHGNGTKYQSLGPPQDMMEFDLSVPPGCARPYASVFARAAFRSLEINGAEGDEYAICLWCFWIFSCT